MVKRKDIAFSNKEVDLEHVDFIIFITRMHDITPPIVRLTPAWAAAAFMLGESIETSAGDPTEAGKARRVVGTNPFIVGSHAEGGNMFLRILRQNPGIQCFTLNTGCIGGLVRGQKITIKDSVKIVEMIARDEIAWRRDKFWGYEVPVEIPGVELDRFNPWNYYTDNQVKQLSRELKDERLNWLSQFPDLDQDIVNAVKAG
jgi:phosphoenolpyruvate carboxykinase (ATP)